MKNLKVLWLLLPIVALIWIIGFFVSDDQTISFPDPAFEEAVRSSLNLDEGPLRKDMINRVESLNIEYSGVYSIEGIEHFSSLTSLTIDGNHISSLEPLAKMERLTSISAVNNQITSLAPLTEMRALTDLNVRENEVESLYPIAGLYNLTSLNIRENKIEDLEPIEQLKNLTDLNARYNNIKSVDPILSLESLTDRLYLLGNPIEDWMKLTSIFDQIADKDFSRPEYNLVFSQTGGHYDEPQTLTIETLGEAEGSIHFTTDGSEPTEQSAEFSEPISIDETTVVRAKFIASDGEESEEITHSYFVNANSNLPMISISTDPDNLFDREKGIYVPGVYYNPDAENPSQTGNFAQSGSEWERPIHLEFFEENGERVLSQHAGIRMHGGASRAVDRKSFRLYARSDYGQNRFRYPVFGDEGRSQYNRLLLRNSGNDWNNTLFRDAMLQSLIKDFNVDTQEYRPAVLYVNGEYWGIYNIRERFDQHYFEAEYGVTNEKLDFLENNATVSEGDNREYLALLQYIRENGLESDESYQQVSSQIDIDNFIDYNIAQIFVRNLDWPGNNNRFWRERPDGKWRWTVFDLDFGFDLPGVRETVAHDTLSFATEAGNTSWPNPDWATFLLRNMLENDDFKTAFVSRFAHDLNSTFKEETIISRIDEMAAEIEPEMEKHIDRWNAPASYEKWQEEVETIRTFSEKRADYVRAHLMSYFDLNGIGELTIDAVSDELLWSIEGRDASSLTEKWQGKYFTDTPVSLSFEDHENIQITSTNEDVAEVAGHSFTLKNPGTASIEVQNDSGEALVRFSVNVEHINQETEILEVGEQLNLNEINPNITKWETSSAETASITDGTLTIEETGKAIITGHSSNGEVIEILNIESIVKADEARFYNADDRAIAYNGLWEDSSLDKHRESLASYTNTPQASFKTTFEGTGIRWIGYRGPTQGTAVIYINGEEYAEVDTFSKDPVYQDVLFEVDGLEAGEHEIEIVAVGTTEEEAATNRIHLDGLEVIR
jgi:hypothetical protein